MNFNRFAPLPLLFGLLQPFQLSLYLSLLGGYFLKSLSMIFLPFPEIMINYRLLFFLSSIVIPYSHSMAMIEQEEIKSHEITKIIPPANGPKYTGL